ncbi:hypothetical protein Tco_1542654, partial [Tanacetum coccineum]
MSSKIPSGNLSKIPSVFFQKSFCDYLAKLNPNKVASVLRVEVTREDYYWQTDKRPNDSGVILMRHMEAYMGTIISKWACRLETEGRKQNTMLARLRKRYAATLLLSKRYVIPTGRVKVPAGSVVPTGKDNGIVSTGRSKVIPAGSTILVLAPSRSKKPNDSNYRTPHWLQWRNHMANRTNIDASKNRRCRAFHLYMDEFCGSKITVSIQWDHRKAR